MFSPCGLNLYFSTSGATSRFCSPSQGPGVWSPGICPQGLPWRHRGLSAWGAQVRALWDASLPFSGPGNVLQGWQAGHPSTVQPLPFGGLQGPGWEWCPGVLSPHWPELWGRACSAACFPVTQLLPANPASSCSFPIDQAALNTQKKTVATEKCVSLSLNLPRNRGETSAFHPFGGRRRSGLKRKQFSFYI